MRMELRRLSAGVAMLTAIGAGAALAQEQPDAERLRENIASMSGEGERRVGDIQMQQTKAGHSARFIFNVDPGKSHFVYGGCGENCFEVLLEAQDSAENIVNHDYGSEMWPQLMVSPDTTGAELHVVVNLAGCETESCLVGAAVYEIE